VRAFHDKVKMVLDPEVDGAYPKRWLGRVSVTLKDGRTLENKITSPKGDPDNVLSRPELEDKAIRLAGYAKGATEAEMRAVIARAWGLHDAADVRGYLD
jgi:2-methylcitrate dehydratase PrpD